MQSFEIRLVALANVSASVTMSANSEAEAEQLAIAHAKEGNCIWTYDGISSDSTIEVGE